MSNQALTADKEAIQLIEKLNLDNIITPSETNPEELLARQSTRKGVPRPPNAFMLFKSSIYREVQCKGLPREMRVITKAASLLWNKMDNGAKDQYRKLAVKVSVLHAQRNPEFRYNPIRRNRATFSAFPTKRRASGRRTDDVRHAQQAQQQTQQQTQQETQQQHNHSQQQQQQQQVHYHQHSNHHSHYHHQHYHQHHQQQQQQQQLQLHHQQQQRQQQTQREPFQSPSNYITELQTQASMLYAASSSPLMIPVPHHVPSLSLHPPLPSPTPSLPSPSSPDKVLAQPQYGQQQPSPQPFASSPQELLVVAGLPSPAQQTLVEPQPLQEFVMSQPILEASPPFNYSFLASEGLGISETSDIGSFDLYSY